MIKKAETAKNWVPDRGREWEVLVPTSPGKRVKTEIAGRVKTFEDKRVGLFWNTKPNGDIFLMRVGEHLKEQFNNIKIIEFLPGKGDTTSAAPSAVIKEVVDKCDIVILSTGD